MISITSFELSVAASVEAASASVEAASASVEAAKAGLSTEGVTSRHTASVEPAEGAGMRACHRV